MKFLFSFVIAMNHVNIDFIKSHSVKKLPNSVANVIPRYRFKILHQPHHYPYAEPISTHGTCTFMYSYLGDKVKSFDFSHLLL